MNHIFPKKLICLLVMFMFIVTSLISPAHAQMLVGLPGAGQKLSLTQPFNPPIIKGLTIYPNNPLQFDFLLDTGDSFLAKDQLRKESFKLVKYFLASLTVPDEEQWVNLSPYEQERIVPAGLGVTLMGRDLLMQDYTLKQLTSSLMNPDQSIGKEFWNSVYARMAARYGTSQIPVDIFNKIWIVPDKAVIYEHDNHVFIVENHLKVLLEEDYLALQKSQEVNALVRKEKSVRNMSSEVIREVLLPEIEKEVNQGKTFSNLRQIFNSMLLATWYKRNVKGSLMGQVYIDRNKTRGVDLKDRQIKDKIFNQYIEAIKKGAYSYIKEDYDLITQTIIPRKYFSGGVNGYANVPVTTYNNLIDFAQKSWMAPVGQFFNIKVDNFEIGAKESLGDTVYAEDFSMTSSSAKREEFIKRFQAANNVALICLKGGLPPSIKRKVIEKLSQQFEVVEGERHKVSFQELMDRWGNGYMRWHFLNRLQENKKLDPVFIRQLTESMTTRNALMFTGLLAELKRLSIQDSELTFPLLVYQYYSGEAQQLFLRPKDGISLNTGGVLFQDYVKKDVLGATVAYDAQYGQLRSIINDELQTGELRTLLDQSLKALGTNDEDTKRFLSSVFNGIHGPASGVELQVELATLTNGDISIFDQAMGSGKEVVTPTGKIREFFYSAALDMHIATNPLKVDSRVIKAADKLGIKLSWDDEGRVINITRDDGLLLLRELGAQALTPKEFWQVFNEAAKARDKETLRSLTSKDFTEWLDVHLIEENGKYYMIEHPLVSKDSGGNTAYSGKKEQIDVPKGRPGWFNPANNIDDNGMPRQVETVFAEGRTTWKYWDHSTEFIKDGLGAIRGYVVSSGTPSLDLGIPPGARQPVLMLRAAYKQLPESTMDQSIVRAMRKFAASYDSLVGREIDSDDFYKGLDDFLVFLNVISESQIGVFFTKSQEKGLSEIRENITNILGMMRVIAISRNDQTAVDRINATANKLFGIKQAVLTRNDFYLFISGSRQRLQNALRNKQSIVFVMGHENPDTDTVISSMMESYRNHLINGNNIAYIPVIQGQSIPDEVRRLLGNAEIAESLLLFNEEDYARALESGQARWILVDHNKAPAVQKFVSAIIDHHKTSRVAAESDVPKTIEIIGSTTALIVQRIYGLGLDISSDLARVLYGATLMDTENRLASKMTEKDKLIMSILKQSSDIINDGFFYQDLMDALLETSDAKALFGRDYKEDWGFGYAVAKMKGVFGSQGEVLKPDLLQELVLLARANNKRNNFPLTLVKVVNYENNNETVNRERLYLIFNDTATPVFKGTMFELLAKLLAFSFKGNSGFQIRTLRSGDFIEFWGVGTQISRKKTAPLLEPVVAAFNRSFYSPSTGLHIQREFLKVDDTIKAAALALGIKLSWDEEGRINRINYYDSIRLLHYLGKKSLSLKEYWSVRKDAHDVNDTQVQQHLQHPGFVEFLDTVIEDKTTMIDHPEISKTDEGYQYRGDRKDVAVLGGVPGLIHPDEIIAVTGLPGVVHGPQKYGDPALWRYWSPDASLVVPTRGHIFLLGQPALDMKIHPDDVFPNLGIRAVTEQKAEPFVKISQTPDDIEIVIDDEGGKKTIHASDFFSNISEDKAKDAAELTKEGTLEDGIGRIEKGIALKRSQSNEPYFIFISGGSASGKTSRVARKLAKRFGVEKILSMDDYYKGLAFMKKLKLDNFDIPQVFDWELINQHIKKLKTRETISKPMYSFKTGEREGYEDFVPGDVIIIEGLYPLHDNIAQEGDYRIFVKVGRLGQLIRRIVRDVVSGRTGQSFRDALDMLFNKVVPAQKQYIDVLENNADLVINNDYKPAEEAPGLRDTEMQAKVRDDQFTEDNLLKMGATRIAMIAQTDNYYTPKDRNISATGELLRIRKEGGELWGTYKGPLLPSTLRLKPKLEFPFVKGWLSIFKSDYKELMQIRKKRAIYKYNELIINVDDVDGLGRFIEVSGQNAKDESNIKEVFVKLGFLEDRIITKSYFDLMLPLVKNDPDQEDNAQAFLSSYGGINFDSAAFDLQIRRDSGGVPLPVVNQPISEMTILGFLPVIVDVSPIDGQRFLGLNDKIVSKNY